MQLLKRRLWIRFLPRVNLLNFIPSLVVIRQSAALNSTSEHTILFDTKVKQILIFYSIPNMNDSEFESTISGNLNFTPINYSITFKEKRDRAL